MSALTNREREIIAAIAEGDTNKAIARRLGVAERTIAAHLMNIRRKLKAHTTAQATAIWARRSIDAARIEGRAA